MTTVQQRALLEYLLSGGDDRPWDPTPASGLDFGIPRISVQRRPPHSIDWYQRHNFPGGAIGGGGGISPQLPPGVSLEGMRGRGQVIPLAQGLGAGMAPGLGGNLPPYQERWSGRAVNPDVSFPLTPNIPPSEQPNDRPQLRKQYTSRVRYGKTTPGQREYHQQPLSKKARVRTDEERRAEYRQMMNKRRGTRR